MGAGYSMRARGVVAGKGASADIFIYEDVGASWWGGVSAKDFAADLKALGTVDTIHLHINSPGGDVFDGLAIYNLLVQHKAQVITHVDGLAASIASVIAMAGNEILISESGFIMIHNASAMAWGEAAELRHVADLLDTTTGTIADVYAARTGKVRADLLAMMDDETWLTAQDALDQGFATGIEANLKVAARAIDAKHQFRKIPSALQAGGATVTIAAPDPARPAFAAMQDRLRRMQGQLQQHDLRIRRGR